MKSTKQLIDSIYTLSIVILIGPFLKWNIPYMKLNGNSSIQEPQPFLSAHIYIILLSLNVSTPKVLLHPGINITTKTGVFHLK